MPKNYLKSKVRIAIIGGTGLEDPKFFKKIDEVKIKTPFGLPSAPIHIADFFGKKVAFLSRHGHLHSIPPHKVNSRANIWALKKLGVERIIGVCAVGSLREEFKPGEIVLSDQFIDFTKKRDYTFYDKGAVHVSLADPFCSDLRNLFFQEAKKLKMPIHSTGTYFCIEGPRFSTRAESRFFKNFADIIGMTLVPEAILARELEICYLSLAMITDYDVWQEKPVNAEEIATVMKLNLEKVKKILKAVIPKIKNKRECLCFKALENAKL
jgi:5'-methylthioadenosine phosphorylase